MIVATGARVKRKRVALARLVLPSRHAGHTTMDDSGAEVADAAMPAHMSEWKEAKRRSLIGSWEEEWRALY